MINLSSHKAFSIYLLFAALFLGVQMFQGLSYLDIGMYMSGYQHFTSDPYASYFLGQWILTYDVTSALCKLFSINSFLGLRVLHLVYVLVTQTVVYLYLRQYISTRSIITGLLIATLAHYGSYTEINYNDYSALLLLLSILCYHGGADRDNQWIIMMGGVLAGVAVYFRIVNITYIC
ncbi:MAG: glycosyltransferase family 39 protein, partial [Prevotella pectinovora]